MHGHNVAYPLNCQDRVWKALDSRQQILNSHVVCACIPALLYLLSSIRLLYFHQIRSGCLFPVRVLLKQRNCLWNQKIIIDFTMYCPNESKSFLLEPESVFNEQIFFWREFTDSSDMTISD